VLVFPDKDPGETLDYEVSFAELLPPGFNLDAATAVIESVTPSESPLALEILSVPIGADVSVSPQIDNYVTVWLTGGTEGNTYIGRITASDDQNAPHDRIYVRRFKIKVKKK
jgi:hypothetical protein